MYLQWICAKTLIFFMFFHNNIPASLMRSKISTLTRKSGMLKYLILEWHRGIKSQIKEEQNSKTKWLIQMISIA